MLEHILVKNHLHVTIALVHLLTNLIYEHIFKLICKPKSILVLLAIKRLVECLYLTSIQMEVRVVVMH